MKLKYEIFFDEGLPFPDFGEIALRDTDYTSSGQVESVFIDKISYKQFIEYCKMLEALPGWESCGEETVARFPKDYNKKMLTVCAGDYHGLHVSVCYRSDKFIEGTNTPNFRISVNKKKTR